MPPRNLSLQPRFPQNVMEKTVECYLKNRSFELINGLDSCKKIFDKKNKTNFSKFVLDHRSHQKRIKKFIKVAVINGIWNNLNKLTQIKDFEILLDEVGQILKVCGIKHVPSLWAYDIALRIGYSRSANIKDKTLPQKYVYNYQGAHTGARIWFSNYSVPHLIPIHYFSQIFHIFKKYNIPDEYVNMHIENMLCHCPKCMKNGFTVQNQCPYIR